MRFTNSVSYCSTLNLPAWKSDELPLKVPNRKWYWTRIGCYLQEFSIHSKSMTIIQHYVFSWWNTWVQEPRNKNRNGPGYLFPIIPSDLGKFLPFPKLWVLQVYKENGKSPIKLFLPRNQLAKREITILVRIFIQIRRNRAVLTFRRNTIKQKDF